MFYYLDVPLVIGNYIYSGTKREMPGSYQNHKIFSELCVVHRCRKHTGFTDKRVKLHDVQGFDCSSAVSCFRIGVIITQSKS